MDIFAKIADTESGTLTFEGFMRFLRETFPGTEADPDFEKHAHMIFSKFSVASETNSMQGKGFFRLWERFMKSCMKPKSALIIVDFQNDFIDGSLSLRKSPRGEDPTALTASLNATIDLFDLVVYSLDWHPEGHVSFIESMSSRQLDASCKLKPDEIKIGTEVAFKIGGRVIKQKLWPRHCVQNSEGAQLHKDLKVKPASIIIHKGTEIDVDSYSAFWDNSRSFHTGLTAALRERGINTVYVVGLAYDLCVTCTALDSVSEGFTTALVRDLTCGISDETVAQSDARLKAVNCYFLKSKDLSKQMLSSPVPWPLLWQRAVPHC